jgi:putative membrane protein
VFSKSLVLAGLLALGVGVAPASASSQSLDSASPSPDAAFLRATHQADLAEIAAGSLARERGVSPRVRALGARFVRDHTAIEGRLTAVARDTGVELPDTPSAAQLALIKKYQAAPAARFDALFLRTQLAAHRSALAAGRAELAEGRDERVKQVASFAGPLVQAHHDALTAVYGGHSR